MCDPTLTAPVKSLKRRQEENQNHGKPSKKPQPCTTVQLSGRDLKLVSNGKMLLDSHIDAACGLLRKHFPGVCGLQSPLLGQNFSFRQTDPPFVQILHVGGIHWNTVVATDDRTIKVYDSLYHESLAPGTSMQSAMILRPSHDQVNFSIENTQEQTGGTDCGLFAIAYATEFCYGNAPECYRCVTCNIMCIILYIMSWLC